MQFNRRNFLGAGISVGTVAGAPQLVLAADEKRTPEQPPFGETLAFSGRPVAPAVQPFPLRCVRLLPGICAASEQANREYLKRLDADRLLHNFRLNAGLPTTAQPLGGWEKPDCELRGHFVGHYLSACAQTLSSTSNADTDIRRKVDYLVAELAKCQSKLPGGYLSAFPLSYFDRLNARTKVWAPFYTIHKIMAGMYDMHTLAGNAQALDVLKGMAAWTDSWTAPIPEAHMQQILDTEYGGMNEVLYDLAALTGDKHYAEVGDRFTKKKFFSPLALQRDELRGLHVNTHIPQVIGAARRYEISGDPRFRNVAEFFWWDVTTARTYVTGGTSNNEAWLTEPHRLGAELKRGVNTTEDCCAYNMLKLTRHLYLWTADPRYFDYYERTLWNHRLPAIDRKTGATQYYLSLAPGAWKTFNTENDSFWCCTGTGVEEFSKLNGNIYFHDGRGVYVNLFIPSELTADDLGFALRQETQFPDSPAVSFTVVAAPSHSMQLHLRIPSWVSSGAAASLNGRQLEVTPSPASYLTLTRVWKAGDHIALTLPMALRTEAMPDEPQTKAFLYGPIVLAGELGGGAELTEDMVIGPMGPDLKHHPGKVPALASDSLEPIPAQPLSFTSRNINFQPFYKTFNQRYSIYWTVT